MSTALDMNTAWVATRNTTRSRTRSATRSTPRATTPHATTPHDAPAGTGRTAVSGPGATRLRLTHRGRVVITVLTTVPLVAVALFLGLYGGGAAADGAATAGATSTAAADFDYVTITSGQSLWQLAEAIAPTADPRDVIAEIVSLNQLPSESVHPGQRLALPSEF